MLATVQVKGRAPRTAYEREQFGQAWADVDRNGCDTRNDMLRRDLDAVVLKPGTHDCVVLSGTLLDPYSGESISFRRGPASDEVQIDHVVALSDAWQKGAATWPPAKRVAFANDPLNLLAVSGWLNQQKSDGDAATWLPPNKSIRCAYVARQTAVKAKYELWMTTAERSAVARVLSSCPTLVAPTGNAPTAAPLHVSTPRQATPRQHTVVSEKPQKERTTKPGGLDPRFPYCKDLPAGYGPYYQGKDPEYDWYRDGDGDGVVCE